MPVEPVTDIGDFVPANPSGAEGVDEGDDHIRNLKTGIQGSFPGFTGADAVTTKSGTDIDNMPDKSGADQIEGPWTFIRRILIEQFDAAVISGIEFTTATLRHWQLIQQDSTHPAPHAFQLRRHDDFGGFEGATEVSKQDGGWTFETNITVPAGVIFADLGGTAGAPAIAAEGQPDTGVFFSADKVALSAQGVAQLTAALNLTTVEHDLDIQGNTDTVGYMRIGGTFGLSGIYTGAPYPGEPSGDAKGEVELFNDAGVSQGFLLLFDKKGP